MASHFNENCRDSPNNYVLKAKFRGLKRARSYACPFIRI